MKLTIFDAGDPSVGLFPNQWDIECPFEKEDRNIDELCYFRNMMTNVYVYYCEGKMTAMYDFEIEEQERKFLDDSDKNAIIYPYDEL